LSSHPGLEPLAQSSAFPQALSASTPAASGFRQPAEWQPHRACWLAFPTETEPDDPELWDGFLLPVREEFVALCRAIADLDPETGVARGEQLEILVRATDQELAASQLAGIPVQFHTLPYGDIWLRDTGPIFLQATAAEPTPTGSLLATVRFGFNGWGEKYRFPGDEFVGSSIAQLSGLPSYEVPFILEGGAIDTDGEGTILTTRQCLLNPNRNDGLSETEIEALLQDYLGAERVLWLDQGLQNDHTDGHIDTLARFIAPGVVLCMLPRAENDPNRTVLNEIARQLVQMTDARGRRLQIVTVPSPGLVLDHHGAIMAASYTNFYIGNRTVVVPTYNSPYDHQAVEIIAQCFPTRRTVGCSARAILVGGGAFHCITQQEPLPV
jgi:agmatine deiminase